MLWVDRYGNCQLNVDPDEVAGWGDRIQLTWTVPPRAPAPPAGSDAYDELGPGQVGLVIDSYGLLAVSVHRGSRRRRRWAWRQGDELHLVRLADDAAGTRPRRGHRPRRPPSPTARRPMRPGTTIVLAVLLALILGAVGHPAAASSPGESVSP